MCTKTQDLPAPGLACPRHALTWHCHLYQIQDPKVNEPFPRDPRKRIIAVDLHMDTEMRCKTFSLADLHIHSENILFSPGCGSFAQSQGLGLPGTRSDAQVLLCLIWLWLCRPLLFFRVSSQYLYFPRKANCHSKESITSVDLRQW